jgi:hypothetical protein
MVPKDGFRAFVYSKNGEQKLVNSYAEFEQSVSSGIWLPQKPATEVAKPKKKGRE